MKSKKFLFWVLAVILSVCVFTSCGDGKNPADTDGTGSVSGTDSAAEYEISLSDSEGGRIYVEVNGEYRKSAHAGEKIEVKVIPQTGYDYKADSFTVNGKQSELTFTMPSEAVSLSAEFEQQQYTITVETPENGTLSASKAKAAYGEEFTVTVTPAAGHCLAAKTLKMNDKIIEDGIVESAKEYTLTMPAKDVVLSAVFEGVFNLSLNGSGTQESPYLISTADDFIQMADTVNDQKLLGKSSLYFRLENDITLPADFTGVGKASGDAKQGEQAVQVPFEGIFDGNGHMITVSMSGDAYVGLFVANQGTIRNLTVAGEVNGAGVNCGALVAFNCGGTVENCVNKAAVTVAGNKYHVGGIAGFSYGGKIDGCKNEGSVTVTAGHTAGGIVGYVGYDAKVTNSENTGAITGSYEIGGIIGYLGTKSAEGTQISGCVNRGTITTTRTTDSRSGGIAGVAVSGNLIESCTNYGNVEGPSAAGGIVGRIFSMTVKNCTNEGLVTVSGLYAGGIVGWNDKYGNAAIDRCVNKAAVTGAGCVGGIAGAFGTADLTDSKIYKCENSGNVTATGHAAAAAVKAGGIAGMSYADIVSSASTGIVVSTEKGYESTASENTGGAQNLNVGLIVGELSEKSSLREATADEIQAEKETN